MKHARIKNNRAVDVIDGDPADRFHPTLAAEFVTVPDAVVSGSTYDPDTDTWTAPAPPAEPEPQPRKLTPIQFKLLFTSQERVAIKASTDPVIVDFLEIINDSQLQEVDLGDSFTTNGLNYLESEGLIVSGRAAEILET